MDLDYAFLAGAAEVGADGRLSVLGADFNQLYGQYPYTVPSMALVVKFLYPREQGGRAFHFSAEFRKPDGGKINPVIEMKFVAPPISMPDRGGALTVIVNLQGVVIPAAGTYAIHIFLDGEEKKAFRLFAEEVPKPERTPVPIA